LGNSEGIQPQTEGKGKSEGGAGQKNFAKLVNPGFYSHPRKEKKKTKSKLVTVGKARKFPSLGIPRSKWWKNNLRSTLDGSFLHRSDRKSLPPTINVGGAGRQNPLSREKKNDRSHAPPDKRVSGPNQYIVALKSPSRTASVGGKKKFRA